MFVRVCILCLCACACKCEEREGDFVVLCFYLRQMLLGAVQKLFVNLKRFNYRPLEDVTVMEPVFFFSYRLSMLPALAMKTLI